MFVFTHLFEMHDQMPTQLPWPVPHLLALWAGKLLLVSGLRLLLLWLLVEPLHAGCEGDYDRAFWVLGVIVETLLLYVGPDVVGKLVGWGAPLKRINTN